MNRPRLALVPGVALVLTACGSMVPNIPTRAPAGYTAAQVDVDEKACAKARRGDKHKVDAYTACMIGKGYAAYFQIGSSFANYANVTVASKGLMAMEAVGVDLRECESSAKKSLQASPGSVGKQAAGIIVGVALLGLPVGAHQDEIVPAFRECMAPRGYTVEPWKPDAK